MKCMIQIDFTCFFLPVLMGLLENFKLCMCLAFCFWEPELICGAGVGDAGGWRGPGQLCGLDEQREGQTRWSSPGAGGGAGPQVPK